MRVLHTSDWHLGQQLYEYDRGPEHDIFLQWLVDRLRELRVDAVIITGDIYDVANPPVEAQQRFYKFLREAVAVSPHLQVVVIGGNHDSPSRIELPKELTDPARVYLIGSMPRDGAGPTPDKALIPLKDSTGVVGLICAAVPYLRMGDLPPSGDGVSGLRRLHEDTANAARRHANGLPFFITGHLHIIGGAVSELSERRIFVGGEEAVAADIYPPDATYVALGHLHEPQEVPGPTKIRYAGSPLPLSVTERNYEHSVVVLELSDKDLVVHTLRTPRPVKFVRVPESGALAMDEVDAALRNLPVDNGPEHLRPFVEIAVSLSTPQPDLRLKVEAALHGKGVRITRILRMSVNEPAGESRPFEAELSQLDPKQVFALRHMQEYRCAPPNELNKAFDELLSAVQTGSSSAASEG